MIRHAVPPRPARWRRRSRRARHAHDGDPRGGCRSRRRRCSSTCLREHATATRTSSVTHGSSRGRRHASTPPSARRSPRCDRSIARCAWSASSSCSRASTAPTTRARRTRSGSSDRSAREASPSSTTGLLVGEHARGAASRPGASAASALNLETFGVTDPDRSHLRPH